MTGTVQTILDAILAVFTAIGEWFVTSMENLVPMFWNADSGALTFYGVLAVAALGVSIILLFVNIIQNFLHFRA